MQDNIRHAASLKKLCEAFTADKVGTDINYIPWNFLKIHRL